LFHVCKKKEGKKVKLAKPEGKKGVLAKPEVKKGELAKPEGNQNPLPSPINSQRTHIDCGDDFTMLVPRVTDLAM
jgi:hypothetical protein